MCTFFLPFRLACLIGPSTLLLISRIGKKVEPVDKKGTLSHGIMLAERELGVSPGSFGVVSARNRLKRAGCVAD